MQLPGSSRPHILPPSHPPTQSNTCPRDTLLAPSPQMSSARAQSSTFCLSLTQPSALPSHSPHLPFPTPPSPPTPTPYLLFPPNRPSLPALPYPHLTFEHQFWRLIPSPSPTPILAWQPIFPCITFDGVLQMVRPGMPVGPKSLKLNTMQVQDGPARCQYQQFISGKLPVTLEF